MESIPPLPFGDFPEDVQLCIISFLRRSELEAFAATSKKYFDLCNNDERLWFLKCSRRWGSRTQIHNWGGGKISYRNLFRLLNQYESLVGIWSYDYICVGYSKLVLFEWGPFYITGNRVLPSQNRGYNVIKKPFLWITVTSDGQTLNYLDRNETLPLTEKDLFREDSEKLRGEELILVDIDLSEEDRCLWLRENRQFSELRKLLDAGNGLDDQYEIVYKSPPDRLMAQMKKILASKGNNVPDIRPSKKERRTERLREREKQRRVGRWRSQRFHKITDHSPTPYRPLQGLWKGIGQDRMLNLYLVSYGECSDNIYGELVGNSSRFLISHDAVFSAGTTAFAESPMSSEEEHNYNTRMHLRPVAKSNQAQLHASFGDEYSHVLRMFYAISPMFSYHGFDDGRVWLYADDTFGFGFSGDNYIVDLKPLLKNGHLLDATDKSL